MRLCLTEETKNVIAHHILNGQFRKHSQKLKSNENIYLVNNESTFRKQTTKTTATTKNTHTNTQKEMQLRVINARTFPFLLITVANDNAKALFFSNPSCYFD